MHMVLRHIIYLFYFNSKYEAHIFIDGKSLATSQSFKDWLMIAGIAYGLLAAGMAFGLFTLIF